MALRTVLVLLWGACVTAAPLNGDFIEADSILPEAPEELLEAAPFLEQWMGQLRPLMDHHNATLKDLSLPGTHDTLTYDLGKENAFEMLGGLFDKHPGLMKYAKAGCQAVDVLPGDLCGTLVLGMANAQGVDLVTQLNGGVRFLDLRTTLVSNIGAETNWFGVHGTATKQIAGVYLRQLHDWLASHPTELVVVFSTRHGSAGEGYATVTQAAKREHWGHIKQLFGEMLFDTKLGDTPLNIPLGKLIDSKVQIVWYQDDWEDFTGSDPQAQDANLIDNKQAGSGAAKERVKWASQVYSDPRGKCQDSKCKFGLFSQAMVPSGDQQVEQVKQFVITHMQPKGIVQKVKQVVQKVKQVVQKVKQGVQNVGHRIKGFLKNVGGRIKNFFHPGELIDGAGEGSELFELFGDWFNPQKCAETFQVPGMGWCPPELMDQALLVNYWAAFVLEMTYQSDNMDFPNAIYMDEITAGGHIRTGTKRLQDETLFDKGYRAQPPSAQYAQASYPYAATMIGKVVNNLCRVTNATACADAQKTISELRGSTPLTKWSDPVYGRLDKLDPSWVWHP